MLDVTLARHDNYFVATDEYSSYQVSDNIFPLAGYPSLIRGLST
jgi:hypothetical protein